MSIAVNANISSADLSGQGNGTKTLTKPTGSTSATDILVCTWSSWESTGTSTLSTPAGWTLIAVVDTGSVRSWTFWALGNVAATGFVWAAGGSGTDLGWVCLGFTGVDLTTPIDATGTASTNTGASSITANAVTVATANAWHLIAAADNLDGVMSATGFTVKDNGSTLHMRASLLYNTTPKSTGSTGTVTVNNSAATSGQELAVLPFALRPAAGGGSSFTASLSGGVTASGGTITRATAKPRTGTATLSATRANATAKPRTGAVTPAGVRTNATSPASKTGSVTCTGATVTRATAKPRTGALTLAGSTLTKAITKGLAGAASLAGAVARACAKPLAGGATLSGSFSAIRVVLMSLTGSITLAGSAVTRAVSKALAGTATLGGAVARAVGKGLAGAVSLAGSFASQFTAAGGGTGSAWLYRFTQIWRRRR